MKPFKSLFYFILFLPFHVSWSLSFDWSGWTRLSSYYQWPAGYYGHFHFVLNSDISISDNLSFKSRWDLFPFLKDKSLAENYLSFETAHRQTGYVFLYKEKGKKSSPKLPLAFVLPTQFYLDYQEEFFKVRLGRAPYHFGLGTTYSARSNPFDEWMSLYNQLALYMEYEFFYIQPGLILDREGFFSEENRILAILQAGIQRADWSLSALVQSSFKKDSFVELFAEYRKSSWDLKASSSYAFKPGTHFSLAFEGAIDLPIPIPTQLELKAGGITGDLAFHPNYDLALLFWNRWMSEGDSTEKGYPYQIAKGQAQNGVYFSPRMIFSIPQTDLQIQPLFLLARDFEDKKFSYEMDLIARYKWADNLFFSLTAGALYTKKLSLALSAQTAASF